MKVISNINTTKIFIPLSCLIFFISSLDAQDLLWKSNFTGSGYNYATKSVIDGNNNLYISGTFNDACNIPVLITTKGSDDAFIAKYDANGNAVWVRQIGGTGNDYPLGISVSPDNEYVYVTGIFTGTVYAGTSSITSVNSGDGFLAKYNKSGDLVYLKNIAFGTSTQRPLEIKVDKNNHLVIVGIFATEAKLGNDISNITLTTSQPIGMFIAQFDTAGQIINAKKLESANSTSRLYTFDSDNTGYYLTGYYKNNLITDLGTITSNNGSIDMFVYKINYNLDGQWIIKIGGTGEDYIYSGSTDNAGNFYFGGNFTSQSLNVDSTASGVLSKRNALNKTTDGKSDIFFAKYNSEGTLQWFNTAGSKGDDKLFRALYKNGNFIAAGQYGDTLSFGNQTIFPFLPILPTVNGDAFAIVQNQNDNLVYLLSAKGSGTEIGESAVVDNIGNFIIVGDYTSPRVYIGNKADSLDNSFSGTRDMFVLKYDKASLKKTITPIGCTDQSNGAISLTPMGTVVPPYSYTWSKKGTTYTANTASISGLSSGTYYVTFTDGLGYTKIDSVVLANPAPISVILAGHSNVSCYNGLNGTIDITPDGGTIPYTYVWSGTGTGLNTSAQDQAAVSYGTYAVSVIDNNGCSTNLSNISITQPAPIYFNETIVTNIVPSVSNGAINLGLQGGTAPYATFAWTGPSGYSASTRNISELSNAGNYMIRVTDSKGCTGDTTIIVNNGLALIAYIQAHQDPKCFNENSGSATASAQNAEGSLSYLWSNPEASTTATVTGLRAGTYYVTVTDAGRPSGSNTSITSITLTQPAELHLTTINKIDISCHNKNDGSLDAVVTGGTIPYTYRWTKGGADFATTEDISGLEQAGYAITITDANNCWVSGSSGITNPLPLSVTGTVIPITCEGGKNDGAITLDVSGAWPTYSYLWSNGITSKNVSLLSSGQYSVTVTDSRNCKTDITKIVGYESPMTLNTSITDVNCKGDLTGTISSSVSGGHLPLSYSWSNNASTANITGLAAGNYTLTVTDSKACIKTIEATVIEPVADLTISSFTKQNVTCKNSNDGSVSLNVSGGTPGYLYLWSGGAGSGSIVTGLFAGSYQVTVSDSKNCQTTASYQVTEPDALGLTEKTSSHVNLLCDGASTGIIEMTATGGSGQYQYLMNNTTWADIPVFSNLSANNYTFRVRDKLATSCIFDFPGIITITKPTAITSGQLTTSNPTCYGMSDGSINYTASGGTGTLSYTLLLNGVSSGNSTGLTSGNFTGVAPGSNYRVLVTDANLCSDTLNGTISLTSPNPIEIKADSVKNASSKSPWNGLRLVEVSGGTAPLSFTLQVNGTASGNVTGLTTGIFTGLEPGNYTISVTDKNNCPTVTSNTLTVSDVTAIRYLGKYDLTFSPNPASTLISLDFGTVLTTPVLLEIISIQGNTVYRELLHPGQAIYRIGVEDFAKGIYLFNLNKQPMKEKILIF